MKVNSVKDAIVLYLAQTGEWLPSYDLIKRELCGKWCGTSSDRRARELAEAGKHKIGHTEYTIESRQSGKYAEFRVTSARDTTPQVSFERRGEDMYAVLTNRI